MQVLALVVLAVASVSSSRSGPYLPSGWRPQGPAFYLPSEVQKPADNPFKDTILNESEASGSDALREYGPPKVVEVSQDLTRQALPDAVTEQAFVIIDARVTEEVNDEVKEVSEVRAIEEVEVEVNEAVEVTTEQKATEVMDAIEEKTTEAQGVPQGRAIEVQTIEEIVDVQEVAKEKLEATTEVVEIRTVVEAIVDSNVESTQEQSQVQAIEKVGQVEVKTDERVQNVADELANLQQEIKAQQIQSNEGAVEVKSIQVLGSAEQAPEGFLEYGPPGFREYGPPQADDLIRSSAVQEATEEEQKIENNETRRRRFSPKFRSSKKH